MTFRRRVAFSFPFPNLRVIRIGAYASAVTCTGTMSKMLDTNYRMFSVLRSPEEGEEFKRIIWKNCATKRFSRHRFFREDDRAFAKVSDSCSYVFRIEKPLLVSTRIPYLRDVTIDVIVSILIDPWLVEPERPFFVVTSRNLIPRIDRLDREEKAAFI